jgi:peptidoglycan/xylan/chitin deacetylase (PgdA/CDA1 family)
MRRLSRVLQVAGIVTLSIVGALFALRQVARSRTYQLFGDIIYRVDTERPRVALTFDDGPAAGTLDSIMALLDEKSVRATFFLMGAAMEEVPEAGPRLVAAGHELGNHTFSHKRMIFRRPSFVQTEVERTDSLIRAAGHKGLIYFRAPYTYKLAVLPWYLSRTGRITVTCDIEPESFPEVTRSPNATVRHVLDRVKPGSIILLHPWYGKRSNTRAALGPLIDSLRSRGYEVGPLRDLIR